MVVGGSIELSRRTRREVQSPEVGKPGDVQVEVEGAVPLLGSQPKRDGGRAWARERAAQVSAHKEQTGREVLARVKGGGSEGGIGSSSRNQEGRRARWANAAAVGETGLSV